ncbi:MAG TPA: MoaD/ThiS family protein [Anaerolineae bacterium]|nr:MoaD/ThiS family protein [Anaerolineae bacterium]
MVVQVKLFSRFRQLLPQEARGEAELQVPEGTTIARLLDHLGVQGRVQLVSVNDEPEPDRDRILHDGDRVRVFPFGVGG